MGRGKTARSVLAMLAIAAGPGLAGAVAADAQNHAQPEHETQASDETVKARSTSESAPPAPPGVLVIEKISRADDPAAARSRAVCSSEPRVGSRIKRTRCVSKEDRALRQRWGQSLLRRAQDGTQPPVSRATLGGDS